MAAQAAPLPRIFFKRTSVDCATKAALHETFQPGNSATMRAFFQLLGRAVTRAAQCVMCRGVPVEARSPARERDENEAQK
jgi:hypothetical protein